jgi:antitoxin component of RelBE/YafQ-DinJ toxin-antitoxin module
MQRIKIRINKKQYIFLRKLIEKQSIHIDVLSTSNNVLVLEITEDDVEKIRDIATDYLDVYGFDDVYELTDSGQLAESLIDILYR